METRALGWIFLVSVLFLSTFGIICCCSIVISLLTFSFGLMSLLYIQQGNIEKFYRNCVGNPLIYESISDGGLKKIVEPLVHPKKVQKTDNRVTGSELIDSSLQEILIYIIRDYVMPWYHLISVDDDFPQVTVKKTAQNLAINISNKVKEVDWIPYLTTRLVDDAASHLRLFKQARSKLKHDQKERSARNSPKREVRSSPKKSHKRNKSETDINWYFGSTRNLSERKDSDKLTNKPKNMSLEDYFFDLECQMENNTICRDLICTSVQEERQFLCELVEILLYILLPDGDFTCRPLRFILREMFSNCVVLPLVSMVSDPDYINQAIIWLCLRDTTLPSDIFLTTLRLTDSCDELKYTKDIVSKEVQLLRSRDLGGESDLSIKQQLSSLCYVLKLIDNRLVKLDIFEQSDNSMDYIHMESLKKVDLPLDVVLRNNVALSYFIDFVSSHNLQHYLFFYLNIDAWRASVRQQLHQKNKGSTVDSSLFENIRSTALLIYEQYLTEKSEHRINIDPTLLHKLYFKVKNPTEPPTELWFDDIAHFIFEQMDADERFLAAFKKSRAYFKLLQELELINQHHMEEDALSLNSLETQEDNGVDDHKKLHESLSVKNLSSDSFLSVEKNIKHVRSLSDVTECMKGEEYSTIVDASILKPINKSIPEEKKLVKPVDFLLSVAFIETGIVCDKGKTFGIYAIQVTKRYDANSLEQWHIYRRYSDFYDLHGKVKERFPDLAKVAFPGKKTFHNMERAVLERRMKMLGLYMNEICREHIVNNHRGLKELLVAFLEQGEYDRATSGGPISHTIDTIVNPIKHGMKTIKNMPEQLINTVDEVVEGINKVFHSKSNRPQETNKVGAGIDIESDDNIPLRIMLLLMDEVFDLKSRNQWLRRRIVTLLRQIVRTMFGDIVNRRILDYVSLITSPKNVAHYLHVFKQSFWPNGMKAESKQERDEATKFRTRIAAKIALLSTLSDELKHIIGSETTRKGLLTIFDLFQKPVLNRRLLYVLLEGILENMFPDKNIPEIFQKLHSKSPRFQERRKKHNTHFNR